MQIKTSDCSQSGLCSSNVCQVAVILSGTANSLDSRSTSFCRITTHDWLRAEESSDHGGVQACPWGIFLQRVSIDRVKVGKCISTATKAEWLDVLTLPFKIMRFYLHLLLHFGDSKRRECSTLHLLWSPSHGWTDRGPGWENLSDCTWTGNWAGMHDRDGRGANLTAKTAKGRAMPCQAGHVEKSKTPRWVGLFSN